MNSAADGMRELLQGNVPRIVRSPHQENRTPTTVCQIFPHQQRRFQTIQVALETRHVHDTFQTRCADSQPFQAGSCVSCCRASAYSWIVHSITRLHGGCLTGEANCVSLFPATPQTGHDVVSSPRMTHCAVVNTSYVCPSERNHRDLEFLTGNLESALAGPSTIQPRLRSSRTIPGDACRTACCTPC